MGIQKLIAQHWVGTISLGDLNIEILPKLYGSVSEEQLRAVLTRIILVSHQNHQPEKYLAQQNLIKTL